MFNILIFREMNQNYSKLQFHEFFRKNKKGLLTHNLSW